VISSLMALKTVRNQGRSARGGKQMLQMNVDLYWPVYWFFRLSTALSVNKLPRLVWTYKPGKTLQFARSPVYELS